MLQYIKTLGGGEYLSAGNEFCDINGVEIGKPGCLASSEEFFPEAPSGIKTLAEEIEIAKGEKATIWVDLVCQDGKSEGRTGTEGNYVVTFYSADPQRTTSAAGKNTTYGAELDDIELASVTIPVASTNYAKIKEKDAQSYLGFYANVYGGKTLTGTWELLDLEGAAEPVELE